MWRMKYAFLFVLTASTAALLPVREASAQTAARNPDGTISVTASAVPLGQVIRAVGTVSPFERLVIEPSAENHLVTVNLANVSVEDALATILRNAGVNYVSAGATRLAIGDAVMRAVPARAENPEAMRLPVDPDRVSLKHVDHELAEQAARSEPDPDRVEPDQEQRRAELETVLVPAPGAPAYRPGFAVLPGENGGTTVVPLPAGPRRPTVALPGLGAEPGTTSTAPLPAAVPVPPGLQPLLGAPVRKPPSPDK